MTNKPWWKDVAFMVAIGAVLLTAAMVLTLIALMVNSRPRGWVLAKDPATHELKIGSGQRSKWISVTDGAYYRCQVGQYYPTCES